MHAASAAGELLPGEAGDEGVLEVQIPVGHRQGVEVLDRRPHRVADHLPVDLHGQVAHVLPVLAPLQPFHELRHGAVGLADADRVDLGAQGQLRRERRVGPAEQGEGVGAHLAHQRGVLEGPIVTGHGARHDHHVRVVAAEPSVGAGHLVAEQQVHPVAGGPEHRRQVGQRQRLVDPAVLEEEDSHRVNVERRRSSAKPNVGARDRDRRRHRDQDDDRQGSVQSLPMRNSLGLPAGPLSTPPLGTDQAIDVEGGSGPLAAFLRLLPSPACTRTRPTPGITSQFSSRLPSRRPRGRVALGAACSTWHISGHSAHLSGTTARAVGIGTTAVRAVCRPASVLAGSGPIWRPGTGART